VGVFLVGVVDVYNTGLESEGVGMYSLRVRDSAGRAFDEAPLDAQLAAVYTYGLPGVYDAIQPGMTRRMVFAFDVLPESVTPQLEGRVPW
jgi:hypothetical protein